MTGYLPKWPSAAAEDRKTYYEATHRVRLPEETLAWVIPLREAAGITRVSDITKLDRLDIPVFIAERPGVDLYLENVSVYNGKGLTREQAKASALMEAFERYSAERHGRPTIAEDWNGIARHGKAVDPHRLFLAPGQEYRPEERLEWIPGLDLVSGEVRFLPAAAVFFPYRPQDGCRFFESFSDTNGLASGNTLAEALSHALSEVIERDTETVAAHRGSGRSIDLDSIDSAAIGGMIAKYRRAGVGLYVKEITSELGVPTFLAASDDEETQNPLLLCKGAGTHLNAEIALLRAITEAAQSRCGIIAGSREDLNDEGYLNAAHRLGYRGVKEKLSYWFGSDPRPRSFHEVSSIRHERMHQDIDALLGTLVRHGLNEVIAVDLTRPDLGIPVVRVVVPGLEPALDSRRRGQRAAR